MISQERVLKALAHQEPDRTPIFEYVLNSEDITKLILGRPASWLHWIELEKEAGWETAVRQLAIYQIKIALFLGHDMMYVIPNPLPSVNSTDILPTETLPEEDPVAVIALKNRKRREYEGGPDKRQFLIYEFIHEEFDKRGIHLSLLAPAYAHGIWTNVNLMQTMLLSPETAHEHFKLATRDTLKLVDKYLGLNVEMIGIGGDFAGNRPLISPALYNEFIAPELKILANRIHLDNGYAVNASDGHLWDVIDSFLIETGVDGYLEIDQHAGMDLAKLKEKYGSRITLFGNMDCGNVLSFQGLDEIRNATVKCLEAGLGNGGHIFTASNAITDSIPVKNYFAMVNAYRDFWRIKKITL